MASEFVQAFDRNLKAAHAESPEEQERIQANAEQFRAYMQGEKIEEDPKGLGNSAIMHYLLQQGLLDADTEPSLATLAIVKEYDLAHPVAA